MAGDIEASRENEAKIREAMLKELQIECPKCHKPYQARTVGEKERVEKYGCIVCNSPCNSNRGEQIVICSKDLKPCDWRYRWYGFILPPHYKCLHTKKTEYGHCPPDNWLFGTCLYMSYEYK